MNDRIDACLTLWICNCRWCQSTCASILILVTQTSFTNHHALWMWTLVSFPIAIVLCLLVGIMNMSMLHPTAFTVHCHWACSWTLGNFSCSAWMKLFFGMDCSIWTNCDRRCTLSLNCTCLQVEEVKINSKSSCCDSVWNSKWCMQAHKSMELV